MAFVLEERSVIYGSLKKMEWPSPIQEDVDAAREVHPGPSVLHQQESPEKVSSVWLVWMTRAALGMCVSGDLDFRAPYVFVSLVSRPPRGRRWTGSNLVENDGLTGSNLETPMCAQRY